MMMGVILYWNAAGVFRRDIRQLLRVPVQSFANTLLLRQNWNMFSRPESSQSRFLYAAELADGRQFDAIHGVPLANTDEFPPEARSADPALSNLMDGVEATERGLEQTLTRLNGQMETTTHDLTQARKDLDAQRAANRGLADRIQTLEQAVAAAAATPKGPHWRPH